MKKITAADRSSLIRLAAALTSGDPSRRAILAGLRRVSMEHASPEALKQYLKEHPDADKSKHSVNSESGSSGEGEDEGNSGDSGGKVDISPMEMDDVAREIGMSSQAFSKVVVRDGQLSSPAQILSTAKSIQKTLDDEWNAARSGKGTRHDKMDKVKKALKAKGWDFKPKGNNPGPEDYVKAARKAAEELEGWAKADDAGALLREVAADFAPADD
jgi:hypothetical protein